MPCEGGNTSRGWCSPREAAGGTVSLLPWPSPHRPWGASCPCPRHPPSLTTAPWKAPPLAITGDASVDGRGLLCRHHVVAGHGGTETLGN